MNLFVTAASSPLPALPAAGFDLKVSLLGSGRSTALARAVHEGQLDGFICNGELWVRRADVHDLLPPGHCIDDEHDACCFIPPQLTRSAA